jgi:hypothetical protein
MPPLLPASWFPSRRESDSYCTKHKLPVCIIRVWQELDTNAGDKSDVSNTDNTVAVCTVVVLDGDWVLCRMNIYKALYPVSLHSISNRRYSPKQMSKLRGTTRSSCNQEVPHPSTRMCPRLVLWLLPSTCQPLVKTLGYRWEGQNSTEMCP